MAGDEETLEVPDSVVVCCPKVGGKLKPAHQCAGCPFLENFVDRFEGRVDLPFTKRYYIKCRFVGVTRELMEIAL